MEYRCWVKYYCCPLCLWALILLCMSHGTMGCLEEERRGLLEIKAFFNSYYTTVDHGEDAADLFPSWVDDGHSECCEWERVRCNATTARVVELSLGDIKNLSFSGDYLDCRSCVIGVSTYYDHLDCRRCVIGFLNVSLFLPFKELTALDLSSNAISDCIQDHGIEKLSSLKALEFLYLSYNYFYNTSTIFQGLCELKQLTHLNLAANNFNGSLPQGLCELKQLTHLDIATNNFNGFLPLGLCELKQLTYLDLSRNNIEGTLPFCLSNLTLLRFFDVHSNQLTGNICSSLISSFKDMEYIDIAYNAFGGLFSFDSLANLTKLEEVWFENDNPKFVVDTESSHWHPKFQLKSLVLSNCNLNKLSGEIPTFLLSQHNLAVLDLSHNNLTGWFPYWLLENNTGLSFVSLRNNSFMGEFHLPPVRNMSYRGLDFSNNNLRGKIPSNIGELNPIMAVLNLSRNGFEGGVPSSIGELRHILALDLSFNNFSGEIPKEVLIGCTNILYLVLSHNRFHGQIFSGAFNMTSVKVLRVDNNHFTGTLSTLKDWSFFSELDVSNNLMYGEIPTWIANWTNASINMRNNGFSGELSCEMIGSVMHIDLSYNLFSGTLPSCSKVGDLRYNHTLKYLHLEGNKITGQIPKDFFHYFPNLLTMNVKYNSLYGEIPNSVGSLSKLKVLLLSGNHLRGRIPNQLCELHDITLMDLSQNFFYGPIPGCFSNITFGRIGPSDLEFTTKIMQFKILPRVSNDFKKEEEEIDFVTKGWLRSYKGHILNYMSGLDLSCNHLSGEIPHELGNLNLIHVLNLSHNDFIGSIPKAFSNLTKIESLDLSYNNLSGSIPSELTDLFSLAVFTVAHNNLTGRIPEGKAQFGTFDATSYEGNPFLCGPLLQKNCTPNIEPPHLPTTSSNDSRSGKWYEVDLMVFLASFAFAYIIFLLGVMVLLYLNPYWRRRWFDFIEECMMSCYYFVCDTLRRFSAHQHK